MMARLRDLPGELKRRHVPRVALAYALISWIVIEASATIAPLLNLPTWLPTLVLVLLALGFPVALVLAWAYDLTPTGVKRSAPLAVREWNELDRLLGDVLELPMQERAGFLDRTCASQPALRAQLDSLIAAHERPAMLDRPLAEWVEPLAARALETAPGRIVSHYQMLEKLGGGGMGVVYKARDLRLERFAALKFLPSQLASDESKQRFLLEAQAAAVLDHPNICTVLEVGETESGQLFIAMPYYDGETIKRRIARGPLDWHEAVSIGLQVARGLAKAHERGIVHRDIKSANLLITSDGLLKIVDFGVAKLRDVSVTRPGLTPGTLAYMSPEQARGDPVDARTDLWSLGVVLYELLTGERPFRAGTDQLLAHAIQNDDPEPLSVRRPDVPAALERVVMRLLRKRPEQRPGSALELARELETLVAETTKGGATTDSSEGSSEETAPVEAGVLPGGERRHATVVVCSLPSSARMVETLVPEALDRILGELREQATAIVERLGGRLNQQRGEDLFFLFGVPTSHEDHCLRAVRAAVEVNTHLRVLATRQMYPELRLHTGIDTGPVVAYPGETDEQGYRIVGAPVQTAAQLAAHAGPDEIWITPECRRLVGVFFESEARDPLSVRDRDRPITPYRVSGHTGLRTRLEAAQRVGLTPHVGRERELGALQGALAKAVTGAGELVTVIGDAGLGKSRLLHEFREHLDDSGVRVIQGRCQSWGSSSAYLPFIEVLRSLGLGNPDANGQTGRGTRARVREIGSELEEFVPLYDQLLSVTDEPSSNARQPLFGDQLRSAMQEALAALLTLYARDHPVVLLLEDWHWADEASHAVLTELAELAAGCRLLILVTTRPGRRNDWGAVQPTTILLEPLPPASSLVMLRSIMRVQTFPEELATMVHERTGGNPFFLEEICQALIEEGTLRVQNREVVMAGSLETLDLPNTVQAVIRTRIDRLDRDTRDVLRLASVVGREFSRNILERALPEHGRLPNALQTLKAAGLIQQVRVVPETLYRFKHVLTQEVTYASLLEHQRKELHGRVARAIEQSQQPGNEEYFDRLAHHFRGAEQWGKAVEYGLRAATRAEALTDFSEAFQLVEQCRACLEHLPNDPDMQNTRVQTLLLEERLCESLGLRARQQHIIDELLAILEPAGERAQLAEVYVRQGDLCTLLRRFGEADAALTKSLQLRRALHNRIGERNTLRSIGLLRWHEGRNREALQCIQEALAIDRQNGDLEALVGDIANQGAVLKALGEYDLARLALEEALEVTENLLREGHSRTVAFKLSYILHNLANVHRELGDNDAALRYLERSKVLSLGKRLPIQLSYHYTSIAHLYLELGRLEESIDVYQEAVAACRRARHTPGLSQALRFLAQMLCGLGRNEEALPHLVEAAQLFAQLEDSAGEAHVLSAAAAAYEAVGGLTEAYEAWERACQLHDRIGDQRSRLVALEALARLSRRLQLDAQISADHYRAGIATAARLGERATEGRLRNSLGILEWSRGDYRAALHEYETALALFRELDDHASAGLMLNSIGVTFRQLGRLDQARASLREALALHGRSGQRMLEAHALAAIGDVCHDAGAREEALQHYGESLRLRQVLDDRAGEGWMLQRIARTRLLQGSTESARELAIRATHIADECRDEELRAACAQLVAG